jgi:branched-chain amino acid transport system permease protein
MIRVSRTRPASIVTVALVILVLTAVTLALGAQKNLQAPQYVQLVIDGIRAGSIYALMALGFVVVYSVTGIINFAQGEFVMLGAMICLTVNDFDLPVSPALRLALAIAAGILLTTLVGIAMERLTIHPARKSPPVTLIIITIGVTLILRAGALLVWGPDPHVLPAFSTFAIEDHIFRFGDVMIQAQSLWIWAALIVILVLLYFFLGRTLLGKALRACAVNRRAAQLVGINPDRMSMLAFAIAAALGAAGGIVMGPVTRPIYDMGVMLGLRGFVAAILGGLLSVPGVVLGGLLLGVVENLAAGVTDPAFKSVVSFVILIILLFFRPQGILGGGENPVEEG